jgi:hypothetical protein
VVMAQPALRWAGTVGVATREAGATLSMVRSLLADMRKLLIE